MKRVVVINGLGVAVPNQALPPGVWQNGQPTPATDDAVWYYDRNIKQSRFFTAAQPPINCRPCTAGDTSPDCCPMSDLMPQYTDYGKLAYQSAVKPWDMDSQQYQAIPTTADVVADAMDQSARQMQISTMNPAAAATPVPDPAAKLAGFLHGQLGNGQQHLLGNGQMHLLGGRALHGIDDGRIQINGLGCGCSGSKLSGVFTDDSGKLTTAGYVAIGGGVAAAGMLGYWLLKRKKRR
jgi:hypothetical protein